MDLSKIKALIIVVLAAFIAVYLGMAAATSKVEVLIWMGSIIAVTGCLLLGKNIWALIPCGLAIAGGLNFLPGAPPVWWLASMAAGGMLLLRFATRKDNFQWRLTLLDWIVFLQFIAVAQAYLRNPTGLSFFGGDMAGGRPYIAFCISFGTYFLLSIMKTDLKTFRIVVICVIAIMLGDGLIKLVAQFVPPFAAMLLPIYSGIDFDAGYMNREVDLMESRVNSGVEIGGTLGLVLVCFYPPLTTINPLFFFAVLRHDNRFILDPDQRLPLGLRDARYPIFRLVMDPPTICADHSRSIYRHPWRSGSPTHWILGSITTSWRRARALSTAIRPGR